MLEKLYKQSIIVVASFIFIAFLAKAWSSVCTKTAVRMYYGSKSSWDTMYILTHIPSDNLTLQFILNTVYEVIDGPTNVVHVTPSECLLNKCKPDLVIANDFSFVQFAATDYPLSKMQAITINYINNAGGGIGEERNIAWLPIWEEKIYFGITKNGPNYKLSNMLIKQIAVEEVTRKVITISAKIKANEAKKAKAQQKIENMRNQTTAYHRIKAAAGIKTLKNKPMANSLPTVEE